MNKLVKKTIKLGVLLGIGYGAYQLFLTKEAQQALKSCITTSATSITHTKSLLDSVKPENTRNSPEDIQANQARVEAEWNRLGY